MAAYLLCYLRVGKSLQLQMKANNNKEVNSVKKADNCPVIIICGDNNAVSIESSSSRHIRIAIIVCICVCFAIAVLTISLCCPDLLPDFVRWIIGKLINS